VKYQKSKWYTYCLNNSLKYTDPSGEEWRWKWKWWSLMLAEIFTGGQISITEASIAIMGVGAQSLANGIDYTSVWFKSWSDPGKAGRQFDNSLRIDFGILNSFTGMFRYDKSAKGIEWPLQVWNNLTGGEGLQTILGNGLAHLQNTGDHVEGVKYYEDRTIVRLKDQYFFDDRFLGISLGSYVSGENIAYGLNDKTGNINLFAHEFGHTFQSRITGPLYLSKYGIPSGPMRSEVPEKDADIRAHQRFGFWPYELEYAPADFSDRNTIKWWEFFVWPFMPWWNY